MSKADWAVARHALREAAPLALLGLLACAAVMDGWLDGRGDIRRTADSTWALLPLVAVAAWAGISVFGEFRGTLAHTLARPVDRGRLLSIRASVFGAALGLVAAVIQVWLWGVEDPYPGPPVAFVVGLIAAAFGVGTLAGACTETETAAVGATVVGLAVGIAPIVMVLNFYVVSWPRLSSALDGLMWPAALVGGASLVWPILHMVGQLPQRKPRRLVVAVGTAVGLNALTLGVVWVPVASLATSSVHGEVMGIGGAFDGPRVVYTGTDGKVDGVYVERGDERVPIYGGGARRGEILHAKVSPDGGAIALLVQHHVGDARRMVLVDLNSGKQLRSVLEQRIEMGHWAPEGHIMAYRPRGGGVALASLPDDAIPVVRAGRASWLMGWVGSRLVTVEWKGWSEDSVLHLVPTTDEGERKSFPVPHGKRAISDCCVAVIETNRRPGEPKRGPKRTLSIQELEPDAKPVTVELDAWPTTEITALGFLDEDHVYVELTDGGEVRSRDTRAKRMYIVHRRGEIAATIVRTEGFALDSVTGPPQGPWLTVGVFGRVDILDRDGTFLSNSRARNLGARSSRWIPRRRIPGGIEFFNRGRIESMKLEDMQ